MKKWIALLMTAAMLATACVAFAGNEVPENVTIAPNPNAEATDTAAAEVSLRVEGAEKNLFAGKVTAEADETALALLERTLAEAEIELVVEEGQYGKFVTAIGGEKQAAFGGYDGWMYFVNGAAPAFGMDAYKVQPGDDIVVAYGDMPTLYPIVKAARGADELVTVSVEADVTTYDEAWNATVERKPVEGVKVTVDGEALTTDAEGKVVLSAELSAKETVSVQLDKKNEAGLPLVYRLAPDFTLNLAEVVLPEPSFPDVAEDAWYAQFVIEMAKRGVVSGMPDGSFQPAKALSRSEVVVILYRLAGAKPVDFVMEFEDVKEGQWDTEAIRWAASLEIVKGADGKFMPTASVTRQDLAVMLTRYQEKVVKAELKQDAEAPAFADNDKIAPYAAEAVYQLQKAGVVSGNEKAEFNPTGTASRAELCKMLTVLTAA